MNFYKIQFQFFRTQRHRKPRFRIFLIIIIIMLTFNYYIALKSRINLRHFSASGEAFLSNKIVNKP